MTYDTINRAHKAVDAADQFNKTYKDREDNHFKGLMKTLPYFGALCATSSAALSNSLVINHTVGAHVVATVLGTGIIGGGSFLAGTISYWLGYSTLQMARKYRKAKIIIKDLKEVYESYKELKKNIYNACVIGNQKIDVGYTALLLGGVDYKIQIGAVYSPPILVDNIRTQQIRISYESEEIYSLISNMQQDAGLFTMTLEKSHGFFNKNYKFSISEANIKAAIHEVSLMFLVLNVGVGVAKYVDEFSEQHAQDIDCYLSALLKDREQIVSNFFIALSANRRLSTVELSRVMTVAQKHFDDSDYAKLLNNLKNNSTAEEVSLIASNIEGGVEVQSINVGKSLVSNDGYSKMHKNLEILRLNANSLGSEDLQHFKVIEADLKVLNQNWLTAQYSDSANKEDITACIEVIADAVSDLAAKVLSEQEKSTNIIKKTYLKAKR